MMAQTTGPLLIATCGCALLIADRALPAQEPKAQTTPFPYELAFGRRIPSIFDRGAMSPDGKHLAFTISTPPRRSPRAGMPEASRYLPGGTPMNMIGARLHLVENSSGKARPIGPEGANSWRPAWSP